MDTLDATVPILVQPEIRARIESLIQDVEDGKKSLEDALDEGTQLIKKMYSQLTSSKEAIAARMAGTIVDEQVATDKKKLCRHLS
ncbi:MAG: hypothetical protein R2741_14955 [Methanolobus sp.]